MADETNVAKTDVKEEQQVTKKNLIEEARDAASELKEQNLLRLEILKKEEELVARREALRELGGDSNAGQREQKKKEETPIEYKDRIMKGLL
jgi:hypothetical protein